MWTETILVGAGFLAAEVIYQTLFHGKWHFVGSVIVAVMAMTAGRALGTQQAILTRAVGHGLVFSATVWLAGYSSYYVIRHGSRKQRKLGWVMVGWWGLAVGVVILVAMTAH